MSSSLLKNGTFIASITDGGELMTTQTERERNVFVRLTDQLTDAGTLNFGVLVGYHGENLDANN